MALGLHFQDPEASYEGYLWEIARTGADSVSLIVSWSQADIHATELAPRAGETPPDEGVRRAITAAHKMGLKVLLFPIIMIERRGPGEWRGKLIERPRALVFKLPRLLASLRDDGGRDWRRTAVSGQ